MSQRSDGGAWPEAALSAAPAVFSRYLGKTGQPFLVLEGLGSRRARLRFCGRLQGDDVVWDCMLEALEAGQACYIEVGPETGSGMALRVGLNLPLIDAPAIRKMIIMIRNYRPLRPGRHEFSGI